MIISNSANNFSFFYIENNNFGAKESLDLCSSFFAMMPSRINGFPKREFIDELSDYYEDTCICPTYLATYIHGGIKKVCKLYKNIYDGEIDVGDIYGKEIGHDLAIIVNGITSYIAGDCIEPNRSEMNKIITQQAANYHKYSKGKDSWTEIGDLMSFINIIPSIVTFE